MALTPDDVTVMPPSTLVPFNYNGFIIAGCAAGGFMIIMYAIAIVGAFVKCKNGCCGGIRCNKAEKPLISQPKRDYSLNTVISPDTTLRQHAVNEDAVKKIQDKKGFDLKKMIGKVLARQVEALMLDPSRLITLEALGEGNFGAVYRATLSDPMRASPTVVAVKCISGDNVTAADLTAFFEEVLRMRHFNHRNVLNMLGLVIEHNMPKVVMPYMANGDLRSYIANPNNSFVARDLVGFGRQVAEGMAYLTIHGFIHRDLAARNCMVSDDNIVKVADFGLSRDIFNADYYKADRKTPLPIRWMAVESYKEGKFSIKSDVWSFGILLWELFTRGSKPYPTLDNATVIAYVRKGERMKKPDYTPDDVYSLMMECWHTDQNKRPNFRDIADTLQRLISGSAENTHPDYQNQAF